MPLVPGVRAERRQVVTAELTAHVLGNPGVHVFATPFVVTLMENTAVDAIAPHVPPGGSTVGTMIEMRHLAATPVGMAVRCVAEVVETDGRRVLLAVEAYDEVEKIAEGRHERFIVADLACFLERAMRKGAR